MRHPSPANPQAIIYALTNAGFTRKGGIPGKYVRLRWPDHLMSRGNHSVLIPLDDTAGDYPDLLNEALSNLRYNATLGNVARTALDDLDLDVEPVELVGQLGDGGHLDSYVLTCARCSGYYTRDDHHVLHRIETGDNLADLRFAAANHICNHPTEPAEPRLRRLFVPDHVDAACDNTSVGALIFNADGRLLVFKRVKPPVGVAPPCGHIDTHGGPAGAVRAEVVEEVGLTVESMRESYRSGGWRNNVCRRHPGLRGFGHNWTVFHVSATGEVKTADDEAKDPMWVNGDELQRLADRTIDLAHGDITAEEFTADPGLEPVWVRLLAEEGLIQVGNEDRWMVDQLANTSPWPQDLP